MELSAKRVSAWLIALIAAVVLSIGLSGCSSEPKMEDLTGKEAVTAFEEIPAIKDYKDNSAQLLKDVMSYANKMTSVTTSDITAQAEAQASLESVCDGVIELKEYPRACEDMYQTLKEDAEKIKEAAGLLSGATVNFSGGMTAQAATKVKQATTLINESTELLDDYDKELAKVNAQ